MKFETQNGWTKDEMLEAVTELMQDRACGLSNGACSYRNDLEERCVIGVFIADEDYSAVFEGNTAYKLFGTSTQTGKPGAHLLKYMPLNIYALDLLQLVHDKFLIMGEKLNKNLAKQAILDWIAENVIDAPELDSRPVSETKLLFTQLFQSPEQEASVEQLQDEPEKVTV